MYSIKIYIIVFLGLSFYLKINGVAIFAKGTNYIPASVFPEKTNDGNSINYLLDSAKGVHMNTIRVWGGGVYESDEFYDVIVLFRLFVFQCDLSTCNARIMMFTDVR